MAQPRFYVQTKLNQGGLLNLPKDVSHHLLHVLRLKLGDEVIVYNGKGGEFLAEVVGISKQSSTVKLIGYEDIDRSAGIDIIYGLCVLKRNAMDRAITRCVELGVHTLTPLISENCAVGHKIIKDRHNHWQEVIIAASEQCGLNILPLLEPTTPILTWLNSIRADLKLIASPDGRKLPNSSNTESIAITSGPEGGFTPEELRVASEASFKPVKLGNRILRSESAPVVALSAIHQMWGDFSR